MIVPGTFCPSSVDGVQRSWLTRVVLWGLFFICFPAVADKPGEHELKAVFIYNFTKFIQWPADSFDDDNPAYHICVYGPPSVAKDMSRLQGRSSGGRALIFHSLDETSSSRFCHILFVAATEPRTIEPLLSRHQDSATLMIGEQPMFAKQYGGIEFQFDQRQRIRLEINLQDIQSRELTISAQLLELAVKVHRTRSVL